MLKNFYQNIGRKKNQREEDIAQLAQLEEDFKTGNMEKVQGYLDKFDKDLSIHILRFCLFPRGKDTKCHTHYDVIDYAIQMAEEQGKKIIPDEVPKEGFVAVLKNHGYSNDVTSLIADYFERNKSNKKDSDDNRKDPPDVIRLVREARAKSGVLVKSQEGILGNK